MNENELIQKLMVSKKIMDKHNQTPRGNNNGISMMNTPMVENFDVPQATYNLPQDFLMSEQAVSSRQTQQEIPTKDRILSSKLPDEIKRLMIEHPISQPQTMSGPTISNDLVNKASRLMKENLFNEDEVSPVKQNQGQNHKQSVPQNIYIKKMVKEAVREILSESGLLVESTSKSNDAFSFRVGQHIFEGKISKIKKLK